MIIRNNRRSLITLEYKKEGERTLAPIPAGQDRDISGLLEYSEIINKGFFEKGWLTIVSRTEKVEIKEEKIIKTETKTKKQKTSNKE